MKRAAVPTIVLVVFVFALSGCRPSRRYGEARLSEFRPPASNPHERIVATNLRLGFGLLGVLRERQPDKNAIVSPLSLGLALAMLYNGAGTTTHTAIGKTLQIGGLTDAQVNEGYQGLQRAVLSADRQVETHVANSLWIGYGWKFTPAFLDTTRRYYSAELQSIELSRPEAVGAVNDWVSKQTNGKITEIVSREFLSTNGTVAILLDAAYFKGKWTNRFDGAMTGSGQFKVSESLERSVPMMTQHGEYQYLENDAFQAISLPYASGRLSFYVFLPRGVGGLRGFCKALTAEKWQTNMAQFAPRKGTLNLPRFKVETDLPLDQWLKQLGMTDAFAEGHADFGPLCQPAGVWIAGARQRTYLNVNEEGTEAAAVTMMPPAGGLCLRHGDEFSMVVDHPFFCGIRDNASGAVLFMGTVVDPEAGR